MSGLRGWIIFAWIALPTVMYGGYSLIRLINRGNVLTPTQVSFFRAGHAHAGVIVILSLLVQLFVDAAVLPEPLEWMIRIGTPASAILISAGFFFSMLPTAAVTPGRAVYLIYAGAIILAASVVTLGVGLLRA